MASLVYKPIRSLIRPLRRHYAAKAYGSSTLPQSPEPPIIRYDALTRRQSTHQTEDDIASYSDDKENAYRHWTLEHDQILWKHASKNESIPQLAARLRRGLKGTEERLKALKDVNSSAYQRLFVMEHAKNGSTETRNSEEATIRQPKLIPASEVLRRIQWDPSLDATQYSIRYYDRVEDDLIDTSLLAPNLSIAGTAETMANAIPEHRIMAILYRERIVWDRNERMDLMFSDPGIVAIQEGYDQWKREQEEAQRKQKEREALVLNRGRQILGTEAFTELDELMRSIEEALAGETKVSTKIEAERFIETALGLFRDVRCNPSQSISPHLIPASDEEALEVISEIVAIEQDEKLRSLLLREISVAMGGQSEISLHGSLPEIDENDIEEMFVRGSG